MHKLGLIGFPLSHSASPAYFADKFKAMQLEHECSYQAFPIQDIHELPALLNTCKGLNVTIPYKESVKAYTDLLDVSAVEAGAVNTLSLENGKWVGYNTDLAAARAQIVHCFPNELPARALILGTGGSAKAVAAALRSLGIPYGMVSRSAPGQLHYTNLRQEEFQDAALVVNCTPVGMFPKVEEQLPIPDAYWHSGQCLFDLIYRPETTRLMQAAQKAGARAFNGRLMLQLQADASWKIWEKAIYG